MSAVVYLVRGAALALAWLLAVNASTTVAIACAAERLARSSYPRPPVFWLALRLGPGVASFAFALVVFVPSYWRYEPRELGEAFALTLIALAAAAVVLIVGASARGLGAWRAASRRAQAWRRVAHPMRLAGVSVPAFTIDVATPIMALAGVVRPRLLITRGVLEALSDDELAAAVAHELGHWRARDNLKRLAMRASPDLLSLTPAAGTIESRWASAAEHAADRQAGSDERARCALASALVKIARLTPSRTPIAEPISTLVDGGDIAARVCRLLDEPRPRVQPPRTWPIAVGAAAAGLAVYVPLLRIVHAATEVIVHALP
jgi:Zn-dependent protease with chaperone function